MRHRLKLQKLRGKGEGNSAAAARAKDVRLVPALCALLVTRLGMMAAVRRPRGGCCPTHQLDRREEDAHCGDDALEAAAARVLAVLLEGRKV